MNEPAFPTYRTYSGNYGQPTNKMVEGISQRRLLAGMILAHIVGGLTQTAHSVLPKSQTIVAASIEFADELIKQTES